MQSLLLPRRAFLAALSALSLAACGDSTGGGGGGGGGVGSVRLGLDVVRIAPADSAAVDVAVLDRNGAAMAAPDVRWQVLNEWVAEVAGSGTSVRIRARTMGESRVVATAGGVSDTMRVVVGTIPKGIQAYGGNGQGGTAGAPLRDSIGVRVVGDLGWASGVGGIPVTFRVVAGGGTVSSTTVLSRSDTEGLGIARVAWTLGPDQGEQTVEASVEGVPTMMVRLRSRGDGLPVVHLASVSADTLVAGETVTLRGRGFSPVAADNQVLVGGRLAQVLSASAEELTLRLPAQVELPCVPGAQPVAVQLSLAREWLGRDTTLPMRVAVRRPLAVGQSLTLSGEAAGCSLLEPGTGWLVSVAYPDSVEARTGGWGLAGRGAGFASGAAPRASPAPARPRAARADRHLRVMEKGREVVRRLGPPRRGGGDGGARRALAARRAYAVGDTVHLRFPELDHDICVHYRQTVARVAYAGTHALVLEDSDGPLAAAMDADYAAVGRELDEAQMGIVRGSFGDPLKMDASLDGNGRVMVFFTRHVNGFPGLLGFVTPVDFFNRTQCPASNDGEVIYALAPGDAPGEGTDISREEWARTIGSTVIHEAKHVASFAERFSRGALRQEEVWLEEGAARAAEEMWARRVHGLQPLSNAGFDPAVRCDLRPLSAGCAGKAESVSAHFAVLYWYLERTAELSPLGSTSPGDGTFYSSAWSLLRWAADHAPGGEAAFFRGLTQEPTLVGIANLEARAGRPLAEMLPEWGLALAADDLPGLTPANPRLRFPSWNLPDVMAGLHGFDPSLFPRSSPYGGELTFFSIGSTHFRGGSVAVTRVAAPAAEPLALQMMGAHSHSPLRLTLLRVR